MNKSGIIKFFLIIILLNFSYLLSALSVIKYELSFENRIHHEAEVKIIFNDLPVRPLVLNMSRASPGDYPLFEFSKNIYNIRAADFSGSMLEITPLNQDKWQIKKHPSNVVFQYTLFGDYMDGTHSSISTDHIYLNVPSAFIWAEGFENMPVEVTVNNPEPSWSIMTQLIPVTKQTFRAPDFYYFMDSPIEMANFALYEWNAGAGGNAQKIRLAVHHRETADTLNLFKKYAVSIVNESIKVFGELPAFDYARYTFITNYISTGINDGMEHRNSCVITSNRSLKKNMPVCLKILAHEFFHAWNIKRIRPKSLEAFNFREANISEELWFVEGFTSYYQDLIILRAKIIGFDDFLESLGEKINYVYNFPGHEVNSPVEMSRQALFFNGGVFEDPTNQDNVYVSYYSYGAVLAFALDLMLRNQFKDISLDDYMKRLWKKYGLTGKGYDNESLKNELAALTRDPVFADNFFGRFVYGKELPDLNGLLSKAGAILVKRFPGRASLGRFAILSNRSGNVVINNYTQKNEPYYKAGLDKWDTILELDNTPIYGTNDILKVLNRHRPYDKLTVKFRKVNGKIMQTTIVLEEIKALILLSYEATKRQITDQIRQFRKNWFY